MSVTLIWICLMLAALSLGLFCALLAQRDRVNQLNDDLAILEAGYFGLEIRAKAAEKELAKRPLVRGARGRFERAER